MILKQSKCRLQTLKCYCSQEENGDEVFIVINKEKIWPSRPYEKIKSMGDLRINKDIFITSPEGVVTIELWERDLFRTELLGHFVFNAVGGSGQYSTDLKAKKKTDIHRYVLEWEV